MYLIQLVFCTTDLTIPAKLTHVYQTEQFTLFETVFPRFPAIGVELSISLAANVFSPFIYSYYHSFYEFLIKNLRATVAFKPVSCGTYRNGHKRILFHLDFLKTSLDVKCWSDFNFSFYYRFLLIRFRKGKFNLWRLY